ncbi:MAG: hypothetical protein WD512_10375 [Candidatus Paceibacterota bacterium]
MKVKALSFIFGLFRKASKKEPLTMLTEEALNTLKNTECVFLRQMYTHLHKAYEANSKVETSRRIALAYSAMKKSQGLYNAMDVKFPIEYSIAIHTLLEKFQKREQIRKDLATAYRLAIQDGFADPLP